MQKKWLFGGVLFVTMLAACGGPTDEGDVTTGEVAQDPNPDAVDPASEEVSETSQALAPPAPSCVRVLRSWQGACRQKNWQVYNGCGSAYNVRIDIQSFPDTSCKVVYPGQTVTFTSKCPLDGNRVEFRGIVLC